MARRALTMVAAAALLGSTAGLAVAQDRTIPSNDIVEQTPPVDLRPGQMWDQPRGEVFIRDGRSVYIAIPAPPYGGRIDESR